MNKMVGKIINNNALKFLILFAAIALESCKSGRNVKFIISEDFTGPCIVLICPHPTNAEHGEIYVENGLGIVPRSSMDRDFIFESTNKKEIDIVEIGKTKAISDNARRIFELTQNIEKDNCSVGDVHFISFYVGTIEQYNSFIKTQNVSLKVLDLKNQNWCQLYQDCQ